MLQLDENVFAKISVRMKDPADVIIERGSVKAIIQILWPIMRLS